LVFSGPNGKGQTHSVADCFKRICKKIGFPEKTLHDLRRYNATILASSGVNLKIIQDNLGHADDSTTKLYLVHNIQAQMDAAISLDAEISKIRSENP